MKKTIIISLLTVFVLLMGARHLHMADSGENIKAAPVDEELTTYYLGPTALDMPKSWEAQITSIIYLGPSPSSPQLNLSEILTEQEPEADDLLKRAQMAEEAKRALGSEILFSRQFDLSRDLGRPARLLLLKTQKRPLENFKGERAQLPESLDILFFQAEPWGFLELWYNEFPSWPSDEMTDGFLEDKKNEALENVKTLLERYEWLGENGDSKRGFIPTKYGRLKISGEPAGFRYELNAHFTSKNLGQSKAGAYLSCIVSNLDSLKHPWGNQPRIVGGHEGKERRGQTRTEKGLDQYKFWRDKQFFLHYYWDDASGTEAGGIGPYYEFYLTPLLAGNLTEAEVAKLMGVWDLALDSLRIVGDQEEGGE